MTLLNLLPSLRSAGIVGLDPDIWPAETHYDDRGRVMVGRVALEDIADEFGTPTYVLDAEDVRRRCRTYRKFLPEAEIAYAGKALLIRDVVRWVREEGLSLDVCSGGELAIAVAAGVDPREIILHGNAKTADEIRFALTVGVGRIVIDSLSEIALIAAYRQRPQTVLLRVMPDVDIHGHPALRIGVPGQKFGFPLGSDAIDNAVTSVLGHGLTLAGLHCHIGSQVTSTTPYVDAVHGMIGECERIRREHGLILTDLDLGGGHGVAYRIGDPELSVRDLADAIEDALDEACARNRFPRPKLTLEPGRAIVAHAGVTVYRVVSVKHLDDGRVIVAVDGGMSDNPRVALYGARYSAALVNRHPGGPRVTATVVGRHCEAGDELAVDVTLPADVHPGDVVAVPCTGAYHVGLGSTYNCVGRPPIVAVVGGRATQLVPRESIDDLLRRA